MKRHGSSDSMAGLISVCQTLGEEDSSGYRRSMLMDEDGFQISEKKRRLGVDQVKALEKYFELENKLDPERKVKLAQELGLQPRQVAVWFQNRRARWKTKQLERDYGLLKANFDSLKHNYDSLKHDNDSLLKQIGELKSKVYGEDDEESNIPTKEQEQSDEKRGDDEEEDEEATIYKEGSSDSDSSAILNDDGNNNNNVRMGMGMGMKGDDGVGGERAYEPEFVKEDEENNNFFSGDESCNFFSDDQAPTLQWYCQDQWNLALMESPPPVSK